MNATPGSAALLAPVVSIKPMQLSGGRTDYFVSIKVGDREVTPHAFREEYKAAYHVALYDWLLNGSGEEPDVVEFGPNDWPARRIDAKPDEDGVREALALIKEAKNLLVLAFKGGAQKSKINSAVWRLTYAERALSTTGHPKP